MSSCTYKFKNASGEEVTITGQAEMKAFLANGGLEQLLPGKVLPWKDDGAKVAEKPVTPSAVTLKGPRRDPTTVSMFNPYYVGDVVTIAGQDWQIQQDMPGWYLTNTGNWRGTHPTIQRIRSMADLIREIERASTEKEAPKNEKPAPAESPKDNDALSREMAGFVPADDAVMSLRSLAQKERRPGYVELGNGKFVTLDQAVAAAKQHMKPSDWTKPFQFNRVLDIAPIDWNRMVEAMRDQSPAESPKAEAKPALSYIQPSKVDTPAQGALANAIEQKSRAWSQVKTLRSRVKDGETNLRVDLLKAEDMWREAKRYEADAREQIEVEANKQGMTTKRDAKTPAVLRTDVLPDTLTIDGVQRPTKNSKGQPIHPTEEGIRNFWRWFSDSKVVDADGRPQVVYHGTTSEIEGGFKPGTSEWDAGIFFTSSAEVAGSVYAQGQAAPNEEGIRAALAGMSNDAVEALAEKLRRQNGGFEFWPEDYGPDMDIPYSKQMADYAIYSFDEYEDSPSSALSITARALGVPAKVPASGSNVVAGMMRLHNPLEIDGSRSEFDQEQQAEWMEQAKAGGHDGLIIRHYKDGGFGGPDNFRSAGRHDVFVAFTPEQIKSAVGNSGV